MFVPNPPSRSLTLGLLYALWWVVPAIGQSFDAVDDTTGLLTDYPNDVEPSAASGGAGSATEAAIEESLVAPESPAWYSPGRPQLRRYIRADFLYWFAGDSDLPSLLIRDNPSTPIAAIGSSDTTRTVIGGQTVGDWGHAGLRLRMGRFFAKSRIARFELDLWYLFENSDSLSARSFDGDDILSRPLINSGTGLLDAQVIALPGIAQGRFDTEYSRQLAGVDPTIFVCLNSSACRRFEFGTGYRFLFLRDELTLRERVTLEPGGLIAPGTGYDIEDQFIADNFLHLWQIGLSHSESRGRWLINVRGNLGLGVVTQQVKIRGDTRYLVGGEVIGGDPAGVLALRTNGGTHEQTEFAWVPEFSLNLKRRLGRHVTAHVGYTVLFLPDVVSAVDHVPTSIDPRNLPPAQPGGGPDPSFAFVDDDLLIHGFNVGLRYDW